MKLKTNCNRNQIEVESRERKIKEKEGKWSELFAVLIVISVALNEFRSVGEHAHCNGDLESETPEMHAKRHQVKLTRKPKRATVDRVVCCGGTCDFKVNQTSDNSQMTMVWIERAEANGRDSKRDVQFRVRWLRFKCISAGVPIRKNSLCCQTIH